jgi:hypothetical protein
MSEGPTFRCSIGNFADALTEVLAENVVGPARRGRLARARAAVKKHPNYAIRAIFLRSKLPLRIGKRCKRLVVSAGGIPRDRDDETVVPNLTLEDLKDLGVWSCFGVHCDEAITAAHVHGCRI